MSIAQRLLPEFDSEMATTRRVLERIPTETFDFKPHDRSGTMQWLAGHVANVISWVGVVLEETELDLNPEGEQPEPPPPPTTTEELLAFFDTTVASGREALVGASDEALMVDWTLLSGGEELFTMSRVAVLRLFVMNHLIHHRGQLTVYLRLNEIPVPAVYGPSADEEAFG